MERVKAGQVWARVKCLRVVDTTREREWEGGGSETFSYKAYVLQCECGKEFEVLDMEFKGKRATKDCGCGLSREDNTHVVVTVTVPLPTHRLLKDYAQAQTNGNISLAVGQLIRKGAGIPVPVIEEDPDDDMTEAEIEERLNRMSEE